MFNRLVDLFIDFISLAKFWFVVEPFEQGHTFHLGALGKPIGYDDGWFGSGFHLIWPLNITKVLYYDITEDSHEFDPRDMTTLDGHIVRVGGSFRYRVRSDKAYEHLVVLGDGSTAITDFLTAAMCQVVEATELKDLFDVDHDSERAVVKAARNLLKQYGYKILDFYWTTKVAPQRTWRIITEGGN